MPDCANILTLRAGDLLLKLVPAIGGSISHFRFGSIDLMRPLSAEALRLRDVAGVAMFPMMPYANRIADNRFVFGGEVWHFPPNVPEERLTVHGSAWQSEWSVVDCSTTQAILSLDYIAPNEPYSYAATESFSLSPERLVVTTALTNRGLREMPFGIGQHPFFERTSDVSIAFHAEKFWMEGPDGIATDAIAVPQEFDFSNGRTLPRTWRNNDYAGWHGDAEIRFPSKGIGLRIEAQPIFGHLMLYADPGKPFFCLEPQTNAVCAFNRLESEEGPDLGVRVLNPNESVRGSIAFIPFVL